jgi:hypothetical protein
MSWKIHLDLKEIAVNFSVNAITASFTHNSGVEVLPKLALFLSVSLNFYQELSSGVCGPFW